MKLYVHKIIMQHLEENTQTDEKNSIVDYGEKGKGSEKSEVKQIHM